MFQNNVLSLPSLLRCVESIQMHGVHNMREDITKNKWERETIHTSMG